MTKKEMKSLVRIARNTMVAMEDRTDLEKHWNNEEDFLDIAVWELEKALIEAYELGKMNG